MNLERLPTYYAITVVGHLDQAWAAWFDGLTITNDANGEAILTGPVADQAALHGLLARIRDLGLPLISVVPGRAPVDDPTALSQTLDSPVDGDGSSTAPAELSHFL